MMGEKGKGLLMILGKDKGDAEMDMKGMSKADEKGKEGPNGEDGGEDLVYAAKDFLKAIEAKDAKKIASIFSSMMQLSEMED